jgi:large subunit ribosomal protein L29
MMTPVELREKKIEDLDILIEQNLKTLFKLRIQKSTDQLNSNHQFKKLRREVARLKTIKNEKVVAL